MGIVGAVTTNSLERWTLMGFSVLAVMEVSQAGDRPCYVGLVNLIFVTSNKHRRKQED